MSSTHPHHTTIDVVDAYGAAWLETDDERRLQHLADAWATDGVYCDPLALVAGRDALSAHVAATQADLSGGRVQVTTTPVLHHDSAFFRLSLIHI